MKKPYKIAIIDYRMSNMFSIKNAVNMIGDDSFITSERSDILSADGAILPGVGSFPEAMRHINELGLSGTVNDFIKTGKPFMGICLGFQLLFNESEEIKDSSGLGIFNGKVKNLAQGNAEIRVPHVGWNTVQKVGLNKLNEKFDPLANTNNGEHFYFVHSCYVEPEDESIIHTTTEYSGIKFCSSVLKENVFACQFHPEKSAKYGIQVLKQMFNQ